MWERLTIAEIAADVPNAVNGGPFGSKLGRKDYVSSGVPVIRGANLPTDRRFSIENAVFVSPRKAEELRANLARPRDVVVTQRGTIGQVGLIPDPGSFPKYVISQSQMKVTVDIGRAEPHFVYYALKAPRAVRRLQDHAMSAGVPHINLEMFRTFAIDVPPLPVQRRIAAVLAAYDELIENNLRRTEILEEMAQAIYREWFVDLRYPDHDQLRLEMALFGELADSVRVHVNPARQPDVEYAHYSFAAFDGERLPAYDHGAALRSGKLAVEQSSVLLGKLNPRISRVWLVDPPDDRPAIASSEFLVLVPVAHVPLSYIYMVLVDPSFTLEIAAMAGGTSTSHQRLKASDLATMPVACPPAALLAEFDGLVAPLLRLISNLTAQNAKLRATRDLLLPRLVSGQIDVSEFDIDTSWLGA